MYDYIIVGAGPTGITTAYLLGKAGKKCLLIDQNESIGGCHRVKRVNGMFTEHAPRVYLNSYVNTKALLLSMNTSFNALYTPYHFSIFYIVSQIVGNLSFWENLILFREFMVFIYSSSYPQTVSVQTFAHKHGFSSTSISYLDRMCRFSDGGGMDRYSMYQLLQLINQQCFYGIYQPRLPNDVGLFPIMRQALQDTGNVTIQLNTTVSSISFENGKANGIKIGNQTLNGENIVLAVPPPSFYQLLQSSPLPVKNAFGDITNWVSQSTYNVDIGVTFHWNTEIALPIVWGFPYSDWGLISIPLTKYMNMNDDRSKTVISTCITYMDTISSVTGKTANQSTKEELLIEIFRQLKESYKTIPNPTTSILSPTVYRNADKWVEQDSGFFKSTTAPYLSENGSVPHLFQVGPQNGNSTSSFTTFEAAVSNGIEFVNRQIGSSLPLSSPIELTIILRWSLFILMLVIVSIILIRYMIKFRGRSS